MPSDKQQNGQGGHGSLVVREYQAKDRQSVIQIYSMGILELVVDTAFRSLKYHTESLLIYFLFTVAELTCRVKRGVTITGCLEPVISGRAGTNSRWPFAVSFMVTKSWWMLGLVPALVLCARYYCSRLVIHDFLQYMLSTDLRDIEEYYMNSPDRCFWVAEKEGKVVGVVAASGDRTTGSLELLRMSVDTNCRKCGLGKALCRKVMEYAATEKYTSIKLGTVGYTGAALRLYESVGFRWLENINGFQFPGTIHHNLFFRIFFRVYQSRYRLDLQNQV
ncbi:N-acetylaspartate synthetase-like isoform X1 [Synchiropus splendidus]|uniref:N-acetylaspartate synthetase-like isoform X1 n=1 Tax=Synchiropus splendidus TaxID=270530 RepID=UPI00237ED302|nr:N-acetylaspartate synthetase-like isoform X1 [Synchiropus splendidus]